MRTVRNDPAPILQKAITIKFHSHMLVNWAIYLGFPQSSRRSHSFHLAASILDLSKQFSFLIAWMTPYLCFRYFERKSLFTNIIIRVRLKQDSRFNVNKFTYILT